MKVTKKLNKLKSDKKGQIFLVCTVVIIIYMLSFITIIYELNVARFTENAEITEFQATYANFRTETGNFMKGLLANYSSILTIIVDNATAGQLLDNWLSFAESQMLSKGYLAVFEINEIVPITTPIELVKANGYLSIRANIDVYLECNYLTIDTELQHYFKYSLNYVNLPSSALIEFFVESLLGINYIGYAEVIVNSIDCINLFNGSYVYSAPLVATDVIQATTTEKIVVNFIV